MNKIVSMYKIMRSLTMYNKCFSFDTEIKGNRKSAWKFLLYYKILETAAGPICFFFFSGELDTDLKIVIAVVLNQ